MKIRYTDNQKLYHVKVLVYGLAGTGKTTLCATAPNPIVLSAESGLLSLRKQKIPFVDIGTYKELTESFLWAQSSTEAKNYQTICLDSLSEVAETVLVELKKTSKDPRQAYGQLQDQMTQIIRSFRDLDKHVYFSAKQERVVTDPVAGTIAIYPGLPGTKLGQQLPYFFDEVFRSLVHDDPATKARSYWLQTQKDTTHEAKDRSGALDPWEEPNLTAIFNKILA